MPTSYTDAVFRTSRFFSKISALEISSIFRMRFVNMLLNSHFTNSTEDEVLSKIHTKIKLHQHKKLLFSAKEMKKLDQGVSL